MSKTIIITGASQGIGKATAETFLSDGWTVGLLARRAEGIHRFQLKIGGDPVEDAARARHVVEKTGPEDIIVGDANCGWRVNEAIVAARGMEGLPRFYFEQPCPTMEECIEVRKHTTMPMVYDEVVSDTRSLLRAAGEGGAGAFNLKVSKVGGLTKAKLMRDLGQELGLQVTIEDTWGGDITTSAIAHLARSTPAEFTFSATDFNSYGTVDIADGAPKRINGRMTAADRPGLGITPIFDALGTPVARYS